MLTLDLNCDMGELKPGQEKNFDKTIMPYISSCNVACGFHSGHPALIEQTIRSALAHQVKVGAHPSYNDTKHFGRQSLDIDLTILLPELRYQISAIKGMVESLGGKLHHVKPHGALYNDMAVNTFLAEAFVQLVKEIDPSLKIYLLAQTPAVEMGEKHGMYMVNEGFADRRYQQICKLRSRQLEGAVLHTPQEVLQQVESFLEGTITLWNGETHPIQVDSICLHSDTEGAVTLSKRIYDFLIERHVQIASIE